MKTITYNPETHVLVPREPSGEMQSAMEAQWEACSYFDMAKREWGAAIAAAPQPEPVDSEPVGYVAHGSTMPRNIRVFKGCEILSKERASEYMPECISPLYTAPQPDRTAELEAALKVARDAIYALQNGLKWYQDAYPDSTSEADHEEIAKVDAAIAKINEVLK